MNVQKSIELLGMKAKDKVTGVKGVVTSISFDLYGCVQAIITPLAKETGEHIAGRWLDTNRLQIISKKRVMEPPSMDFNSPPGPAEKPTK